MFACALAPVLAGYAAAQYDNKRDGMIAGYRVILRTSVLLLIFYVIARFVAIRQIRTLRSTGHSISIIEMQDDTNQMSPKFR